LARQLESALSLLSLLLLEVHGAEHASRLDDGIPQTSAVKSLYAPPERTALFHVSMSMVSRFFSFWQTWRIVLGNGFSLRIYSLYGNANLELFATSSDGFSLDNFL
jgi:hypothetical protein